LSGGDQETITDAMQTLPIRHRNTSLTPTFTVLRLGRDELAPLPSEQLPQGATRPSRRATIANDHGLQREAAAFLAELPSQQRAALMLRLRHRLGYAEIAAALGCDEHEARLAAYEALRALRTHLGDRL
jgi:DNA-directed RNA polymerase specialized sigma24 family protein